MKTKILIATAIEALDKNLADHVAEYADAIEVWTTDAVAALEALRDALDRKGVEASSDALWRIYSTKPIDNRKQYSKFLGMLRRAQESDQRHIEVDEDDYDRIFQDNWDWRRSSKAVNATYSSRKQ